MMLSNIPILTVIILSDCRPLLANEPIEIVEKLLSSSVSFANSITNNEASFNTTGSRGVCYYFYERNKDSPYEIIDSKSLHESPFKIDKKTIFVVHGYEDRNDRSYIVELRKALVENLDANVIVVDWSKVANQIYYSVVANHYSVGRDIGSFISFLELEGVNLDDVHIIGHSLGAHLAGVAGEMANGKVGRITGLDPAGPMFEFFGSRNTSQSLDPGDAKFVDVIHTSIGTFGFVAPIGHADFYPNEGLVPQPGCYNMLFTVSCSHVRAVHFFIESIGGEVPFVAKQCRKFEWPTLVDCATGNYTNMGYHVPTSARGLYILQTNSEPPYALGKKFYKRALASTKINIH